MDTERLIDKYMPVDYSDHISGKADHKTDVDTLLHLMFEDFPVPVKFLLKLRDALVKSFGLTGGTSFRKHIIERTDNEIIVGMDDKHLGFWVSIYVSEANNAEVQTTVRFNNTLGRIYLAGIWCFHKLIVSGMFRRAIKTINSAQSDSVS